MAATQAIRAAVKRLGDEAFDRWLGVDTAAPVLHEHLEFGDGRGDAYYQATNWMALAWVHRTLRRFGPARDESFVEFGAGKGRVVLIAASHPFRSVIGVELSESLAAMARANVERNRSRFACGDVRIEQADMASFQVPDDLAIAFFYNPARGDAFVAAVDRIRESLERRPRRFRLIYGNPVMHDHLIEDGFHVAHSPRLLDWKVYGYGGAPAAERSR